ncbi:MAG: sodium/glutamate symporter [Clostridiaceae bacterium]
MAAVILLIGFFIKSKVKFLEKYCIPAPVVGGFLFYVCHFYWSCDGNICIFV